ncbi:hypothetical protein [Amaricoccus sp.]|uniref:hypothetical protein n=1 Tax=Amaricoccus sp. TaxID=1872485 RepID=UPI001B3D7A7B|nr:hypothetical protein [Amaricoccus sp.]MBP7242825.1 hypothetical protein [Amaricoccus sp.]
MRARLLCAAALAATAAAPAWAASDPLQAAWEAASADREGSITDQQFARLNVIAYHGAAASLCEGLALDGVQVADAVNAILQANPEGATAEALVQRHVDILVALGTARGLFLAEGSLHPDRFCASAKDAREAPDFDDFWID